MTHLTATFARAGPQHKEADGRFGEFTVIIDSARARDRITSNGHFKLMRNRIAVRVQTGFQTDNLPTKRDFILRGSRGRRWNGKEIPARW